MDTLHEDQFTFMITSLSMIHRMRNVSDKLGSEKSQHILVFYVQ